MKTICSILLAAVALSFLFIFLKSKDRSQGTAKRPPGLSDTDYEEMGSYSQHKQSTKGWAKTGIKAPQNTGKSPAASRRDSQVDQGEKIRPHDSSIRPLDLTGHFKSTNYFPSRTTLADIADYDALTHSYALKKIDLFANEGDVPTGLLSALKILNRKDMPADYFRWWEYELAYNEIDMSYPDYYVWPYFTNREAKTNFFLYLFSKYAADNKKWRSYEKNVSDCSQFSQRVYLLMYPGEVSMEDEQYFRFLFSDEKTREERNKLCNKIPNVFYVSLTPYILKQNRTTAPPDGHAIISFAPDGSLQDVILAEPQSGAFESLEGNLGNILVNEQLTQYPQICQVGKILSIQKDKSHEAEIAVSGTYFLPRISASGIQYGENDPRLDYGQKPILLQDQTYSLFQAISFYLEGVLNYQPIDRIGFLHSLDNMIRDGRLSLPHMESEISSSTEIVMHGLITLDDSDLKRIKDEMEELKDLAGAQPSLSPQLNDLVTKLNYLFLLKLDPLLG